MSSSERFDIDPELDARAEPGRTDQLAGIAQQRRRVDALEGRSTC